MGDPDATAAVRIESGSAPAPSLAAEALPVQGAPGDPADGAMPRGGSWMTTFADELGRELRQPAVAAEAPRWRWPAWVALAFLGGVTIALLRLGLGLRAVHALRGRARPVGDLALLDAVDLLRAEMSCTRQVEVRESPEISAPATIGWRRPAVLLPDDWRGWDDRERRVVLAHELAHICRGDYLSGLGAQFSLALHFYHPAAHLLADRLRLQQELAADAWGARLVGGDRSYLTTLAEMALRQDERPLKWPARAFLPTRGTFLRRIEMLRDANQFRHAPMPRRARALTIAVLALAGLLVAGLRGPNIAPTAQAQAAPPAAADPGPKAAAEGFDLTNVPAETTMLIAGRPAELLKRPDLKALVASLKDAAWILGSSKMPPVKEIDQFLGIALWRGAGEDRPERDPRGLMGPFDVLILRTSKPRDWKAATADLVADPVEARSKGRVYHRSSKNPNGLCVFAIDDRTVALAREASLKTVIAAATRRPVAHRAWFEAWKLVKPGMLAIAAESSKLSDQLAPGIDQAVFRPFSPLWDQADAYAIGIDPARDLAIDAVATCNSDEDAQQVAATVEASLTLARNTVQGILAQEAAQPPPAQGAAQPPNLTPREALDVSVAPLLKVVAEPFLKAARVEHDGTMVRLQAATGINPADVVKLVLSPALFASRSAALRAQSVNNMKLIGLAMHNYYNANDHLPPAVGFGPDGKTPHSWRVAILPHLERQELYNAYRFDEPWDSPSNRKVLEKMPDVYRVPESGGDPTHPSYFAVTGPETIFADAKGTSVAQINDGTTNTILVVEAKRAIPWTKPEDIPLDDAKPSRLGGYFPNTFNVGFGDGSVKGLKSSINEAVLRALFTRAGGEVISADSY